jgi:Mg-chelatase subunit ChlD
MIHLEFPEFLWLGLPLAYGFVRWGGFRPAWIWAVPVVLWVAVQGLIPAPLPGWSHVLLGVPVWLWLRPWLRRAGVTGGLRLSLLLVLLLALTGPSWNVGGTGLDVLIVADRSRSMPADAQAHVRELIRNVEANRGPGDRVAIITFGSIPQVERDLSRDAELQDYTREILPDGSDLQAALLAALNRVDPDRPARMLVLSDGEANGPTPLTAARRARELGVPIDYRTFERLRSGDAAIRGVSLPETVVPREPFQFTVEVTAPLDTQGTLQVFRDGELLSRRETTFPAGSSRWSFRDLLEDPGLHAYEARLELAEDLLRENNLAAGVVRVEGGPRLLVLSSDGVPGRLVQALRAARLTVDTAVAAQHPLTLDALDPYRAVLIENVPAAELGRVRMEELVRFVKDLGGGLLLTGGRRSFGVGGYFNSPLDEALPVSMEIREEHRKTRVAIAIALDRSGSMAVPVQGNRTKMDLANLGAAECVQLLSASDSVAVIAVDSAPHVVQPLTAVSDPGSIAARVRRIESEGGGIFVYEALIAAGNELLKASQATKHIILFSDAADSEEPGAYQSLLSKFQTAGITVSVIGLGSKSDVDASLLEDIARRGQGNILFTTDPEDLPRLFTEDTMSVARSSFVEKDPETQPAGIAGRPLPDAVLLGNLRLSAFPHVDGYNLSYLRPEATAAVISADEYAAPWSAFWYYGLGRVAALCVEVDGPFSGELSNWDGLDDLLITQARWLLGGEDPREVYVDVARQGQDAVITVELDPDRPERHRGEAPLLKVVPPGEARVGVLTPDLEWLGPDLLQARIRLNRTGTWRTLVQTSGPAGTRGAAEFRRGPVVTLPYSPEFDPREGLPSGREVLAEVAALSGGVERADVLSVLRDPPRGPRSSSLLPWLIGLGLSLLIMEIAGRRLSLWEGRPDESAAAGSGSVSASADTKLRRGVPRTKAWWRLPALGGGSDAAVRGAAANGPPGRERDATAASRTTTAAASAQGGTGDEASAPATPERTPSAAEIFAAAKEKARHRLK